MKKKALATLLWSVSAGAAEMPPAETMDFYVDQKTRQVFVEAGPGRVKLGTFVKLLDGPGAPASGATVASATTAPTARQTTGVADKRIDKKWYERLSLRGYLQMRYNHGIGGDADLLRAPGDRFIGGNQSLGIRRARLVISGDVSEYVSIYLQPDFASSPSGSSTFNFGQLRDAYADIYFDSRREFRLRAGQSKVPYGFENLQSSQNRLAPDRADALNSGVRDERDLGLFLYYSPTIVAERFQHLVKSGLKGSGDYGMVGLGVYNGQGANRPERNQHMHSVLHFTYPFLFENGQYFQVGADAYTGRFKLAEPARISYDGQSLLPADTSPGQGYLDRRVAVHAIYYPQPFGLQAEWTIGRGPQLDLATGRIETRPLRGGYVQAMYKIDGGHFGSLTPYLKWQTYRGASKFDVNAPRMLVNETEAGLKWQPWPALEVTASYARMRRTNVGSAPYHVLRGDLLRLQLQVNY